MRRKSCYHVGMRSPSWTHWHRLSIDLDHAVPNGPLFLPFKEKQNLKKIGKASEKIDFKKVWTLYKMYKNEGLLLYVIAVLYFVLLRFLWSKLNNIFYDRFLISTLSLTLYLNSHYLCAKWNGNEKIRRKDSIIGAILIFYFCMNCIEKKKTIVPFHQCQLFVYVEFERERQKSNRYTCCIAGFLSKTMWDGFAIARLCIAHVKCHYQMATAVFPCNFFFSENNVHEMIVFLAQNIFYGRACTVGFIP